MKKESIRYSIVLIVVFVVFLVFTHWFFNSRFYPIVDAWIKTNVLLYVVVLFAYKTIGILFPPLPSGLVTLASIPFLGWVNAYIIDLTGSIIGGIFAYWLGSTYGRPALKKIFTEDIVDKIAKTKIKKGREIEAVFMFRILMGTTVVEAVYYGAGFLKIPFNKFIIGATASHIAIGVPSFLLANNIFSGKNMALTVVLSILALVFVLKAKGRYFE